MNDSQIDRQREYERLEKDFEHDFKSANYLLVAHGAALLACVTSLKEYSKTPELHGIGIFAAFFAAGFIFAALGYAGTRVARNALVAVALGDKPRYEPPVWMLEMHIYAMTLSFMILLVTVMALIPKLALL